MSIGKHGLELPRQLHQQAKPVGIAKNRELGFQALLHLCGIRAQASKQPREGRWFDQRKSKRVTY